MSADQVYEVEAIIDDKITSDFYPHVPERRWCVKWMGYSQLENTWEPKNGLCHLEIWKEYEAKKQEKLNKSQSKTQNAKFNGVTLYCNKTTKIQIDQNDKRKKKKKKKKK